ncbi:MAG: hypothetical protein CVV07_02720 [Gammaproteobacteria bacterium HGW-Gammaproteobacteria-11]|nr:MAG: hypothetical protein CVV07_02720 [Gammaproteobacteria bacterium HGW-Gammaproteobacteria-11]
MKILKTYLLLLLLLTPAMASAQVPEIPDPNLNDIAMVFPHPDHGAVIVYNPTICQQIGAACGFFRAHEYGHVVLGHTLLHPSAYPAVREAQADEWAAANGRPNEILAAYYLFLNGGSSENWQVYGHPQQRAERLRLFAIQYGTWIGP